MYLASNAARGVVAWKMCSMPNRVRRRDKQEHSTRCQAPVQQQTEQQRAQNQGATNAGQQGAPSKQGAATAQQSDTDNTRHLAQYEKRIAELELQAAEAPVAWRRKHVRPSKSMP